MKTYKNIFFDLDHTLWDFDRSSLETMKKFYSLYKLQDKGIPDFDAFHDVYVKHNIRLWGLYRDGEIEKEALNLQRFHLSLVEYGINNLALSQEIADYYVRQSPLTTFFYPYAEEILEYLHPKYRIHVITNGFEEVQRVKISNSFLKDYIDVVITSEEAGVKKPDRGIFDYAFQKTGAIPESSIMIGDDPDVDILGARNVGMDQVFFNPEEKEFASEATHQIKNLVELKGIL